LYFKAGFDMRADDFDVFISYSRADWREAADIEDLLRAASLKTFFDRRELAPGLPWVRALEETMGKSRVATILIGPRGFGNTQQYERELAFFKQTRDPQFRVIPVLLPGSHDTPTGFLQLLTWIDFSAVRKIADAPNEMARLVAAVRGEQLTDASAVNICPYRGLDAFREEDSPFYFGRGRADDPSTPLGELFSKTRGNSFVMVVGRSGSGKSSLVFAGLMPALRRNCLDTFWHVLSFRPGAEPLRTLAETFNVRREDEGMASYASKITAETARLRDGDINLLGHIIGDYLASADGKPDRLLLYVDQWEELYAQASAAGTDERVAQQRKDVDRFIDLLLAATQTAAVTVVATVRADFYDSLVRHPQLRSVLPAQQVNLSSVPRSEMRLSITEPAKMVGLKFDPPSLVDRILDETGEDEGMLPLLQYALKETFLCREGKVLTADSYERSGGVQRAIRTAAERNFEGLSNEDQIAARRLFLRLVTPGEGQEDTRARAAMPTAVDLQKIIRNFASPKTRLLVTGRDRAGRATVEVAHEALIRTWPRLREWVDANREMLRARAAVLQHQAEWESNKRRDDLLLPAGFQLERARALLENPGDITIDDIQEYISTSIKFEQDRLDKEKQEELEEAQQRAEEERVAREAAEKARKKFQRYFVAAAILGLIAGGNAVYALAKKVAADNARREAIDARDEANKSVNLAGKLVSVQLGELRKTQGVNVSSLKRILDGSREPFDEVAGVLSRNAIFRTSYADMMTEYGRVYLRVGDLATALDFFEKSLSIRDLSNKQDDRVASLRGIADQLEEIARIMQQRGNLAKAAEDSDRAFKLRSEIVNLSDADALSFWDLGRSLYQRGDLVKLMTKDAAAAADIQETARTMMETSRTLGGPGAEIDFKISLIHGSLADHYEALGNKAKRQVSLSESLRLLKELHDRDPNNAEYTRYLAWAHQALGGFYLEIEDWKHALEQYQACLDLRQELASDDPFASLYQYDLAWAHHLLGDFYLGAGGADVDKAASNYGTAYEIRKKLTRIDPSNTRWRKDLALSLQTLGDVAKKRGGQQDTARQQYEAAREIMQKLVDSDPDNNGWRSILSGIEANIKTIAADGRAPQTLSTRE
jgi:tetratricopeptide (TPR) repeat protein/energy-coupling factor transporter ATP-binding protein EcfA2